MADKKTFTIVIDGVEKSYNNVIKLSDALNAINNVNTSVAVSNKEVTTSVQEKSKATDELSKAQEKLTQYDAEYQKQLALTKAEIAAKNKTIQDEIKSEQALATVEANVQNSYKDKQKLLTALGNQIKSMVVTNEAEAKQLADLKKQYADLNTELKDFDKELGNHQRNVGDYSIAGKALKEELGQIEEKLTAMLVNGVKPTDEAFQELAGRAGEIKQAIQDAGKSIDSFASHNQGLNDVIASGQAIVSVFGTATGIMNMFGGENEEVAAAMQKMMGVMTTLQSLQTLQNTLTTKGTIVNSLYTKTLQALGLQKKTNAALTTAETAANTVNTASTVASTAATQGATIATRIWNAVLRANPLFLILGVISAVVGAISIFSSKTDDATSSQNAFNNALDATKGHLSDLEYQMNFNSKLMAAQGKNQRDILVYQSDALKQQRDEAFTTYRTLDREYSKMRDSAKKKNKEALDDAKKLYDDRMKAYRDSQDAITIYDVQSATDKKKKDAEDAKQAGKEFSSNLKNYKKQLETYLKESNKMELDNHKNRIETAKTSAVEMTAVTQDELAARNKAISDAYQQEMTYSNLVYENDKTNLTKRYEEQIAEAKKLGQDTTAIKAEYDAQVRELDIKAEQSFDKLLKTRDKAVKTSNENYTKEETDRINKLREEQNKAIDRETKDLQFHLNTINQMKEDATVRGGKFNLIDVEATKSNLKEVGGELKTYLSELEASKKRISNYYDALISTYQKDSQEYKDANQQKTEALNDIDRKIKNTNKDIADNTQATTQVVSQYWEDVSAKIGSQIQLISDSIGTIFDTVGMFFDAKLEEAQEKLEEITEKYEAAVELQQESNERLVALQEEAKTASGGRALVVQDEIQREMALNKELANQEKQLAKEKEKREKEAAKIEKQQKKADLMANIVSGISGGALAVINALQVKPFPLGVALAAVAGAMSAAQVGIMSSQLAKLEDGGLLQGKRHSEGGIPVGNTGIEVEGGEYVTNRNTTAKNLGLLSYINSQNKELGIGDFISYYDDNTGKIVPNSAFKKMFEDGGQMDLSNINTPTSGNEDILNAINNINFNPVVSVVDIIDSTEQVTSVRDSAGFS